MTVEAARSLPRADELPGAPSAPLRYRDRLRAIRQFHTGMELIRDVAGPVAMLRLGPAKLVPTFAIVTSPQGAHDVLAAHDGAFDKEMIVHVQNRSLGDNLFNLRHQRWVSRRRTLQPVFTKQPGRPLRRAHGASGCGDGP